LLTLLRHRALLSTQGPVTSASRGSTFACERDERLPTLADAGETKVGDDTTSIGTTEGGRTITNTMHYAYFTLERCELSGGKPRRAGRNLLSPQRTGGARTRRCARHSATGSRSARSRPERAVHVVERRAVGPNRAGPASVRSTCPSAGGVVRDARSGRGTPGDRETTPDLRVASGGDASLGVRQGNESAGDLEPRGAREARGGVRRHRTPRNGEADAGLLARGWSPANEKGPSAGGPDLFVCRGSGRGTE